MQVSLCVGVHLGALLPGRKLQMGLEVTTRVFERLKRTILLLVMV